MNLFNQFFHNLRNGAAGPISGMNKELEAWNRSISRESAEQERVLNMAMDHLLVSAIDSETTGFNPQSGDEMMSLAAVKWDGKVVGSPFHSFIRIGGTVPSHISALTGIQQEQLLSAPPINEVLTGFLNYVGTSVLIGYYVGHDTKFINYFLWKNFRTRLKHRVIEMKAVVDLLCPEHKPLSFDDVCQVYEVTNVGRHTAIGDATVVLDLWSKLVISLKAKGIKNLTGLYEQLALQRNG